MQISSFPDSLKFGALRSRGANIKQDLAEAYQELTTGRRNTREIVRNLNGRVGDAHLVRRDIETLERRDTSFALGLGRGAVIQNSLDQVLNAVGSLPEEFSDAAGRDDNFTLRTASQSARSALDNVTSALNIQQGRRFLFSGDATDRAAIVGSQEIINQVELAIDGLTTAADVNAALDTFFGAGGTFETAIYNGGAGTAASIEITEGDRVQIETKADNEAFREVIRGLAVGALISDAGLEGDERDAVIDAANDRLVNGIDEVAFLISQTGLAENRIVTAQARNTSEEVVLNEAYNAMTGRDGFDAATRAQELEVQLQTTYTVTSRLSQLNFNNFIS